MATKGNKETGYVHDINDGGLDKSDKRRNGQKGTSLKDYKRETDRQTKTDRDRDRTQRTYYGLDIGNEGEE